MSDANVGFDYNSEVIEVKVDLTVCTHYYRPFFPQKKFFREKILRILY